MAHAGAVDGIAHVQRNGRWAVAGMAVALAAAAVGFLALRGGSDDLEAVGAPAETTSTTTTTAPLSDETTAAAEISTTLPDPAVFTADATIITTEFSPLAPGSYRVDKLGTPMSFSTDTDMFVQINSYGSFVLTAPSSQGPDDRDIFFIRLTDLSDPADPGFGVDGFPDVWPLDFGEGWPAGDPEGWLDNLPAEVVISDRIETTLGGVDAVRADLELDESDCGLGEPCMLVGSNNWLGVKMMSVGSRYRVWFIDQEDEDPLAVIVATTRESDSEWFETAETVLSTVAFGEVGPNPVSALPAGSHELQNLGGIRIELQDDAAAFQQLENFDKILPQEWPTSIEFLINPLSADGAPLATADELAAAMAETGTVVTEVEPATVGGLPARVYEIGGASSSPALQLLPDDERGYFAPQRGRMWLIEHPDRGLLMITAEAATDVDEVFPVVLGQAEAILASLEFIELG